MADEIKNKNKEEDPYKMHEVVSESLPQKPKGTPLPPNTADRMAATRRYYERLQKDVGTDQDFERMQATLLRQREEMDKKFNPSLGQGVADVGRGIVQGPLEAAKQTTNFIVQGADAASGNKLPWLREWAEDIDPSLMGTIETESIYGELSKGLSQFLVPYAALGKMQRVNLAKKAQKEGSEAYYNANKTISKEQKERILSGNKGAKFDYNFKSFVAAAKDGMARGFVVDMLAFDPATGSIGSHALPALETYMRGRGHESSANQIKEIAEYLTFDAEDFNEEKFSDEIAGRFVLALEGAGLGAMAGTAVQAFRYSWHKGWAYKYSKDVLKLSEQYAKSPKAWTEALHDSYLQKLSKLADQEKKAFDAGVAIDRKSLEEFQGNYNKNHSTPLTHWMNLGEDSLLKGDVLRSRPSIDVDPEAAWKAIRESLAEDGDGVILSVLDSSVKEHQNIIKAKSKRAGRRVGAWYNRGTKKMYIDQDFLEEMYTNKAWEQPKVKDAAPLSMLLKSDSRLVDMLKRGGYKFSRQDGWDIFKSKDDLLEFIIEHERVHARGPKAGLKPKGSYKSVGEEENHVNLIALRRFLERRRGASLSDLMEGKKLYQSNLLEEQGVLWKVHGTDVVLDQDAIIKDYEDNFKFLKGISKHDGAYQEVKILDAMELSTDGLKEALDAQGGSNAYIKFLAARAKLLAEEVGKSGGTLPSMGSSKGMQLMMKVTKEALTDPKRGLGIPEETLAANPSKKLIENFDASIKPFEPKDIFRVPANGIDSIRRYISGKKTIKGADGKPRRFTMAEALEDMRRSGVFNPDTMFAGGSRGSQKTLATVIKIWEKELTALAKKTTKSDELQKMLGMADDIKAGRDINDWLVTENRRQLEELADSLGIDPEGFLNQIENGEGLFEDVLDPILGSKRHGLLHGDVASLHTRLGAFRFVIESNAQEMYEVVTKMSKLKNQAKGAEAIASEEGIQLANRLIELQSALKEDISALKLARRSWGLAGQSLQKKLMDVKGPDGQPLMDDDVLRQVQLAVLDENGGLEEIFKNAELIAATVNTQSADESTKLLRVLETTRSVPLFRNIMAMKNDYMVNAMLSSPKTQGVNILSTALRSYINVANIKAGAWAMRTPYFSWAAESRLKDPKFAKAWKGKDRESIADWSDAYADAMFANLNDMYLTFLKHLSRGEFAENSLRPLRNVGDVPTSDPSAATHRDLLNSVEAAGKSAGQGGSTLEVGSGTAQGISKEGLTTGLGSWDMSSGQVGFDANSLTETLIGGKDDFRHKYMSKLASKLGVGEGRLADDILAGADFAMKNVAGLPMKGMVYFDEFIKQVNYRTHIRSAIIADFHQMGKLTGPNVNVEQIAERVNNLVEASTLANGQHFTRKGLVQQCIDSHGDDWKIAMEAEILNIKRTTGMNPQELEEMCVRSFTRAKDSAWQKPALAAVKSLKESGDTDVTGGMFEDYQWGTFTHHVQQTIRHPAISAHQPFVLTPANLMKFIGQHSVPFNFPLVRKWHQQLKQDLYSGNEEQFSEAFGRLFTGTALWITGTGAAYSGITTGYGPLNKDERDNWKGNGVNEPFAFRTPVGFVPYNRADPIATFFAVPAAIKDAHTRAVSKQEKLVLMEYATIYTMALVKSGLDKSYIKNITNAAEAITAPDRKMGRYMQQRIAAHIPTIAKDFSQSTDPMMRETLDYIDALNVKMFGVPFFVKELQDDADMNAMPDKDNPRLIGSQAKPSYAVGEADKLDIPFFGKIPTPNIKTRAYYPPERNVLGEPAYKHGNARWQMLQKNLNPTPLLPYNEDIVANELAALMFSQRKPDPELNASSNLDRTLSFADIGKVGSKEYLIAKKLGIQEGQSVYDYWLDLSSKIRLGGVEKIGKEYFYEIDKTSPNKLKFKKKLSDGSAGLTLRESLTQLIKSDKYQELSSYRDADAGIIPQQITMIQTILDKYRKAAWDQIKGSPSFRLGEDEFKNMELATKNSIVGYTGVLGTYWPAFERNLIIAEGNSGATSADEKTIREANKELDLMLQINRLKNKKD